MSGDSLFEATPVRRPVVAYAGCSADDGGLTAAVVKELVGIGAAVPEKTEPALSWLDRIAAWLRRRPAQDRPALPMPTPYERASVIPTVTAAPHPRAGAAIRLDPARGIIE